MIRSRHGATTSLVARKRDSLLKSFGCLSTATLFHTSNRSTFIASNGNNLTTQRRAVCTRQSVVHRMSHTTGAYGEEGSAATPKVEEESQQQQATSPKSTEPKEEPVTSADEEFKADAEKEKAEDDITETYHIESTEAKDAEVLSEVASIRELEKAFVAKYASDSSVDVSKSVPKDVTANEPIHKSRALAKGRTKERIDSDLVRPVSKEEDVMIDFQKYAHNRRQDGPFIGSELRDVPKELVEFRKRREIERVMPFEETYMAYETSFRRLPEGAFEKLPSEGELRVLYPQATSMTYEVREADCVEIAQTFDKEPEPIIYCRWVPPNFDPKKTYPVIVCVPDGRGLPVDFDDMCANMWQRDAYMSQLLEQQIVLLCPVVNLKAVGRGMEHVVVSFIDWVVKNYNCENGKPHLLGKGNGASTVTRVGLAHKEIVHSIIAICGKLHPPLYGQDRAKVLVPNLNGTHMLVYLPGNMFKPSTWYRFKGLTDFMKVRPAVRMIHFEMVRDQQLYYVINPIEFWNYFLYFRQYHTTAVTEAGRFYYKPTEWFNTKNETLNADSKTSEEEEKKWY